MNLFSTDVTLDYEKVIDYYSLRFQIEFVFRDAKQYWGMEDSMNIKKIPIHNWANLSTFMVNFSHGLRQNSDMNEMSILDLKAHYHGLKYVKEVFKLLPHLQYLSQKAKPKIKIGHEITAIILNQKNIKLSHDRNYNTLKMYRTYNCKKQA
ncbi:MAG: hypothetical protein Q9M36_06350 [Sulfurovum sp.]|nr:hypothetical protein [Sulfurovum sp.]